ncbi:MAG: sugar ABC transporter substrate-binding protein [Pseudomonadota bacterium]
MSLEIVRKSVLVAAGLLIIAGCGSDNATTEAVDDRPVIALVMKSLANEFFVNMAEGAQQHQREHSTRYELIVNGIKDESDLTQQVALIEQMMARGVDALVVAPADSRALVPVLARAAKSGVVVINIDNALDADLLMDAGTKIPFIGPDNREGARLAGDHLAAALTAGDQVAIVGGIPTAFNAQQRQAGFEDAMAMAGMELVSVQAGNWEQAKASTVAAALIAEHPDLKAMLCSNDNMAIGAIAAIRQAGKTGDIQVVGFDNIAAARELIGSGELLATVDQFGDQLATYGIEYALEILSDGDMPRDRKTPVKLITANDLK